MNRKNYITCRECWDIAHRVDEGNPVCPTCRGYTLIKTSTLWLIIACISIMMAVSYI